VRRECQSALEVGWGGSKIQRLKFDSIFFTDEEPCWQRKIQFEENNPKSDVYGLK